MLLYSSPMAKTNRINALSDLLEQQYLFNYCWFPSGYQNPRVRNRNPMIVIINTNPHQRKQLASRSTFFPNATNETNQISQLYLFAKRLLRPDSLETSTRPFPLRPRAFLFEDLKGDLYLVRLGSSFSL